MSRHGAQALWGRETMAGMADGGLAAYGRLEAELGYGMPVGGRRHAFRSRCLRQSPRLGQGTAENGVGSQLTARW